MLEDFSTYAKQLGMYNEYSHNRIYSANFASEMVTSIEKHTCIKYDTEKSKRDIGKGLFSAWFIKI